jgi:hypothetical protein
MSISVSRQHRWSEIGQQLSIHIMWYHSLYNGDNSPSSRWFAGHNFENSTVLRIVKKVKNAEVSQVTRYWFPQDNEFVCSASMWHRRIVDWMKCVCIFTTSNTNDEIGHSDQSRCETQSTLKGSSSRFEKESSWLTHPRDDHVPVLTRIHLNHGRGTKPFQETVQQLYYNGMTE